MVRRLTKLSVEEALAGLRKGDGCFGVCDAGQVPGSHLANHTAACQRAKVALGAEIPAGWAWRGDRLVFEASR